MSSSFASPEPSLHRLPTSGWSLEQKLPVLISALLASVVGAFGAAAYHEMRAVSVERATERLESVARQLAAMSSSNSVPRLALLRTLAADSAVVHAVSGATDEPGARAAVVSRLSAARQPGDSNVIGWELWASDGTLRMRAGAAPTRADSLALLPTRAAVIRTDSLQRSAFYHVRNRVAVWTAVPVSVGGRTVGLLAERRRLAASPRTEQMIRQLTGEDVTLLFTSRGSSEWATIGGAPVAAPFTLPTTPRPGVGRAVTLTDPRGARQYVAQQLVPQTPWIVVLAEAESDVLRRPRAFLQTMLTVGGLLLAAGAITAWLLGRHVTGPLRRVTHAAEALARGDYASRVAVTGGADLARLATTFNDMATGIGTAHAELADRNLALQRANAAKAQFLAMMSHELRTPLNAIGGYTELMAMGIRGPVTEAQLEDLARIRRSKDHLLSIITDLLSFARADAGHLTLAVTDVTLRDVLTDVEAALRHQFADKGVTLQIEPVPPDTIVRADREKAQQVVLNLLTNALRFTDAGGVVTVSCTLVGNHSGSDPGGMVRIDVRDTGIGIPADKLDAIFEPFVQVDAALTRRVGGTGLGLAIVRNLVSAMHGTLGVESVPGVGSTFTVTLPRAAAPTPVGANVVAGVVPGAVAPPLATVASPATT